MILDAADWMHDILREHLEELSFLLPRRFRARRSARETTRSFRFLDGRIEAHVDALVLAEGEVMPALYRQLRAKQAATVGSAAFVLLRMPAPAPTRVLDRLETAGTATRRALRWALCASPVAPVEAELEDRLRRPTGVVSITAAQVLAFHGRLRDPRVVFPALTASSAAIRAGAWRTVAALGTAGVPPNDAALRLTLKGAFERGIGDPARSVREAAFAAATWTRQPWLLQKLRELADRPGGTEPSVLALLATLGEPGDGPRISSALDAPEADEDRFERLATFAFREAGERLVQVLEGGPGPASELAAAAFARLTGRDVESSFRTQQVPGDEVIPLPVGTVASAAARTRLADLMQAWGPRVRMLRGRPATRWTEDALEALDRRSLWELRRRQAFLGEWDGRATDLGGFL